MASSDEASIIIKKIKKVSGGHHGGAWKVAYADFVTAMMAFFLLLWLLSSTSESQKEGIAEYFTPTVGLRDQAGIGFEGGETANADGTKKSDKSPVALISGGAPQGQTTQANKPAPIDADQEAQLFEQAREEIKQAFEDDPTLREFKDNIIVEQTPEGLKIEIVDSDKNPMFQSGNATLSPPGQAIVGKMAEIVQKMPNYISVTGHTDSTPLRKNGGYTNWELSADRANSARRFLTAKGMEEGRMGKVVGMGAMELLNPDEPTAVQNRRISIILLKGSHFGGSSYLQNRPGSLLSLPKVNGSMLKKPDTVKPVESQAPAPVVAPAPAADPTPEQVH